MYNVNPSSLPDAQIFSLALRLKRDHFSDPDAAAIPGLHRAAPSPQPGSTKRSYGLS